MFEISAEMVDSKGSDLRETQKGFIKRTLKTGEFDSLKAPKTKLHAKETPFLCDMWSEISKDLREIFWGLLRCYS